jgi:hypothetical protein
MWSCASTKALAAAGSLDALRRGLRRLPPDIGDQHMRAKLRQTFGQRRTIALSRPGDQNRMGQK